jgi:hypothetical protein
VHSVHVNDYVEGESSSLASEEDEEGDEEEERRRVRNRTN